MSICFSQLSPPDLRHLMFLKMFDSPLTHSPASITKTISSHWYSPAWSASACYWSACLLCAVNAGQRLDTRGSLWSWIHVLIWKILTFLLNSRTKKKLDMNPTYLLDQWRKRKTAAWGSLLVGFYADAHRWSCIQSSRQASRSVWADTCLHRMYLREN